MAEEEEKHDISELVEARHHRAEIVFGVLSLGFALVLATQIESQTTWVKGLELVRQPGFWPVVAIIGMTVFGIFEFACSWRRNKSGRGDSISGEVFHWIKALEYVAWFLAYTLLVPVAGYLPTTMVFSVLLTVRVGYRSKPMLLAALAVGVATVIVFKGFLSVKIPGAAVYEFLPDALRNFMILYL